jgi:hypothetical protein
MAYSITVSPSPPRPSSPILQQSRTVPLAWSNSEMTSEILNCFDTCYYSLDEQSAHHNAPTCTWNTNGDLHPSPEWELNPRSQFWRGRRQYVPQTAQFGFNNCIFNEFHNLENVDEGKSSTVAARSKAWTLFDCSNAGIIRSIPALGMVVCVRLFYVCVVLCVGRGLATGWSPVQGFLPNMYRIKKLKKQPRSAKDCRATGR